MPADPHAIALARSDLRAALHALTALSLARRDELLRDRPTGNYAATIAQSRAVLRAKRAVLAALLAS